MNDIVYIDANVYLRFFNTNSKEFKRLLTTIEEIADCIFITDQIKFEIERNKLDVFKKSFDEYLKRFNLSKINLPEHILTEADGSIGNWNKSVGELNTKFKAQYASLESIGEQLMDKISRGEDAVSKALDKLYTRSQKETVEQLGNARLRKERGNPPGKVNDTLGDQISWEQLLTAVANVGRVFMITGDGDFYSSLNNKLFLTPFLKGNLLDANPSLKYELTDSLGEGLKSFLKANPKQKNSLPNQDELNKIHEEEKYIIQHPLPISGSTGHSITYQPLNSFAMLLCPFCNNPTLQGPIARNSQYGYMTVQYFCTTCKKFYDTGDSND